MADQRNHANLSASTLYRFLRAHGAESLPPRRSAGRRRGDCARPLYSTHDQDENGTRTMAKLCQSLLRLRDTPKAVLIVVHFGRWSGAFQGCCRAKRGGAGEETQQWNRRMNSILKKIKWRFDAERPASTSVPKGSLSRGPRPSTGPDLRMSASNQPLPRAA